MNPAATPLISVLLPCRNAAAFLPDCIKSIEAQTLRDFEVIAVDDSSTDDSRGLLAAWAARDARVHVLANQGTGLVSALNTGLSAARAPLIARMDADDRSRPARFACQHALFEATPGLAACGTQVRYFPRAAVRDGARRYEAWLNALISHDDIARNIFVECPIAHPTLMIRTAELRAVAGYQDHGWPEDYDLMLRLFVRGARLQNVPAVLHDWRERPDRASRVDARYSPEAFRRCKAFYLMLALPCGQESVIVWGAGPVGKAFALQMREQGIRVAAFVDIDSRKIGQSIHGADVITPADLLARRGRALVISAVSGADARAQIRDYLIGAGLEEGRDFVAVA